MGSQPIVAQNTFLVTPSLVSHMILLFEGPHGEVEGAVSYACVTISHKQPFQASDIRSFQTEAALSMLNPTYRKTEWPRMAQELHSVRIA